MSSSAFIPDSCGCCEGIRDRTPLSLLNPEGQSALRYRIGSHPDFKSAMIALLSAPPSSNPLRALTSRQDDDPTIALIDAWAVVLDILTFYQERIANEGYLRTAVERMSVLELARAVGYRLSPGVAATTHVAFVLENAKTVPTDIAIPAGTRIQSVPGPNEVPQVFETLEEIEGRRAWNEFSPQMTTPALPGKEATWTYLLGTSLNLQVGDALLFVSKERFDKTVGKSWALCILTAVTVDRESGRTYVEWSPHPAGDGIFEEFPAAGKIYVMRQRASIFGYNAPNWQGLSTGSKAEYLRAINPEPNPQDYDNWPEFTVYARDNESSQSDTRRAKEKPVGHPARIDLDRVYPKIVQDCWAVLSKPGECRVFNVTKAEETGRSEFMLSGKVTRLTLQGRNLDDFEKDVRTTTVFVQSEEVRLAEYPLVWQDVQPHVALPVMGDRILVDRFLSGSAVKRPVIVTGKRLRAKLPVKTALKAISESGIEVSIRRDESVRLLEPPKPSESSNSVRVFRVLTDHSFEGHATAHDDEVTYTPALDDDDSIAELATLHELHSVGGQPATLIFETALENIFDRNTVKIYGNVASVSHGETRQEILGSGDGAQSLQSFTLKNKPLTYIPSVRSSGSETTLRVRVNDVLWKESDTLYEARNKDQVMVTRHADDGSVTVQFGDGQSGSRLPTGVENVSAEYRVGIGLEGQVRAGQLSLLLQAPLGVKSVVGPLPAAGAADPESRDDARQNAPIPILAMGRVVSLSDFENFARAFAGIGKAQADWIWNGRRRFVHLTVASQDGSPFGSRSTTLECLKTAIEQDSDGLQPFTVTEYQSRHFKLSAAILVDPRYVMEKVFEDIEIAVTERFSFAHRQFGQNVSESEVVACIQSVAGVTAVTLEALYFAGSESDRQPILPGAPAKWTLSGIQPATVLTTGRDYISLTKMQP